MDKAALEYIAKMLSASTKDLENTDAMAVIIPEETHIHDLTYLMDNPRRFKARYNTHIIKEFIDYSDSNPAELSAVYIDQKTMSACQIFDHGNNANPMWGEDTATLSLEKTEAYKAILNGQGRPYSQQELTDFLQDWPELINFYDTQGTIIDFHDAINRILRLTVNTKSNMESAQGNFKNEVSAMESIEIKSGENQCPAYFIFEATTFEGFKSRSFRCIMRSTKQDNEFKLKYRIESLQSISENIALEFRNIIENDITATVRVGTIELG